MTKKEMIVFVVVIISNYPPPYHIICNIRKFSNVSFIIIDECNGRKVMINIKIDD